MPFKLRSHKSINSSTVGSGWSQCCRAKFKQIGPHSFPRNPRICFFNSHGNRHSDVGGLDRIDSGKQERLSSSSSSLIPPNKAINIALSARLSVSKRVPSISNKIALIFLTTFVDGSSEEQSTEVDDDDMMMPLWVWEFTWVTSSIGFFACGDDENEIVLRIFLTEGGDKTTKPIADSYKSDEWSINNNRSDGNDPGKSNDMLLSC